MRESTPVTDKEGADYLVSHLEPAIAQIVELIRGIVLSNNFDVICYFLSGVLIFIFGFLY